MTASTSEYLTIDEAAEMLRVSTSTIRRWIREGDIVGHRVGKRRIVLKREEIMRSVSEVDSRTASTNRGLSPMGFQWPDQPIARRLTSQDIERRLSALAMAKEASARIQKRTGVDEFPPSWPLIRDMREERTRQLLGDNDQSPGPQS